MKGEQRQPVEKPNGSFIYYSNQKYQNEGKWSTLLVNSTQMYGPTYNYLVYDNPKTTYYEQRRSC